MDHRRPFFTILYHLSTIKGYICDISQTTSTIRASLEPLVVVQRNCLAFFVYLLLCPGRVASNCRYNQPSSEVLANDPGTSWQSLIAWPPSVIAQCIPIVGILSVKSWTLGRFTKRKFWKGWGQIVKLRKKQEVLVRFGWNFAQLFRDTPWSPGPGYTQIPQVEKSTLRS